MHLPCTPNDVMPLGEIAPRPAVSSIQALEHGILAFAIALILVVTDLRALSLPRRAYGRKRSPSLSSAQCTHFAWTKPASFQSRTMRRGSHVRHA